MVSSNGSAELKEALERLKVVKAIPDFDKLKIEIANINHLLKGIQTPPNDR